MPARHELTLTKSEEKRIDAFLRKGGVMAKKKMVRNAYGKPHKRKEKEC